MAAASRWTSLCAFHALLVVHAASAQVKIALEPDHVMGSDTLWVDVRMSVEGDSLPAPVSSFAFRVDADVGIRFLTARSSYTLSENQGWTTGYNALNGRVGGYAAANGAIVIPGVIIRLQFLLWGTDTTGNIALREFRLNSGMPDHFPAIPSLRLDPADHPE